jgi:hypothetical protein
MNPKHGLKACKHSWTPMGVSNRAHLANAPSAERRAGARPSRRINVKSFNGNRYRCQRVPRCCVRQVALVVFGGSARRRPVKPACYIKRTLPGSGDAVAQRRMAGWRRSDPGLAVLPVALRLPAQEFRGQFARRGVRQISGNLRPQPNNADWQSAVSPAGSRLGCRRYLPIWNSAKTSDPKALGRILSQALPAANNKCNIDVALLVCSLMYKS